MSDSPDDVGEWMAAGGAALLTNVPMSPNRFEDLATHAADSTTTVVVDFGCGRGAFAHRVAELAPSISVRGIDVSEKAIGHASTVAAEADLHHLRFDVADASGWTGRVDTAVCLGSSHAFGPTAEMFDRLYELGAHRAVVGDGFWHGQPDDWCLENLGEMARSVAEVSDLATARGWVVDELDVSTLDEWDAFERHWAEGVRTVGTPGAIAFAEQRTEEYQRYRGVLGFAWLQLRRA